MAEPPDDWRQHPNLLERWQQHIDAEHKRGEWKTRWLQEPTWTAAELATLCCGWSPDSEGLPPREAFLHAMERIIRAVRAGELVSLRPGIPERHQFFDRHPYLFKPGNDNASLTMEEARQPSVLLNTSDAAKWAAPRFQSFPFQSSASAGKNADPVSSTISSAEPVQSRTVSQATHRTRRAAALGKVLHTYFNRCGLTIEDFASQLELNESSVKRHFGGSAFPRPRHLAAYVRFFNQHLALDPPMTAQTLLNTIGEH